MMLKKIIAVIALYTLVCFAADSNYVWFNNFCKENFGASKDSLIYVKQGYTLNFNAAGKWKYESLNSACIAFETNLPCHSKVRYGTTTSYTDSAIDTSRYYYLHLYYLTELEPGTTYHYDVEVTDERDTVLTSADSTFATVASGLYKTIPDSVPAGPPYVLSTASKRYILTEDITADSVAIEIAANSVELDLNGHTIVYNNRHVDVPTILGTFWDYFNNAAFGVKAVYRSGAKIFNGIIYQGPGNDSAQQNAAGFSPILLKESNSFEIAGVSAGYKGCQITGFYTDGNSGITHHNVASDSGTEIINRHQGCDVSNKSLIVYNNRVNRTKHRAFSSCSLAYNNEVYLDGYAANQYGFGLFTKHNTLILRNKVFGTGYATTAYGFTLSDTLYGVTFISNIAHLTGDTIENRSDEYGDRMSLNGFRCTQYSGSYCDRVDWVYDSNVIIINAKGMMETSYCQARGFQIDADPHHFNFNISNTKIKVFSTDSGTSEVKPICVSGNSTTDSLSSPVYYNNCTIISNRMMIRFGDWYSCSGPNSFSNMSFVKCGPVSDKYTTFGFGYYTWNNTGNYLSDASCGGVDLADVTWKSTGGNTELTIQWGLTVLADSGDYVKILDSGDSSVSDSVVVGDTTVFYLDEVTYSGNSTSNDTIEYGEYRVVRDIDTIAVTMDTTKSIDLNTYYSSANLKVRKRETSSDTARIIVSAGDWKSNLYLMAASDSTGPWSSVDSSIGLAAGAIDTLINVGTKYLRVRARTTK